MGSIAIDGQLKLTGDSAAPAARLYFRRCKPDGAPKAVVLIAHGFGEHVGRYGHVAAALNKRPEMRRTSKAEAMAI